MSLRDTRPEQVTDSVQGAERRESPWPSSNFIQKSVRDMFKELPVCYAISSTAVNAETGEGSQKEQVYIDSM